MSEEMGIILREYKKVYGKKMTLENSGSLLGGSETITGEHLIALGDFYFFLKKKKNRNDFTLELGMFLSPRLGEEDFPNYKEKIKVKTIEILDNVIGRGKYTLK